MLLESYNQMNNQNLSQTVQILEQIHPILTTLAQRADQSIQQSDQKGEIGNNALYVLREERELISGEDMMDYIVNYPHCQMIKSECKPIVQNEVVRRQKAQKYS